MISIFKYLYEQDINTTDFAQLRRNRFEELRKSRMNFAANTDLKSLESPTSIDGPKVVKPILNKIDGPTAIEGPHPVDANTWGKIIKKAANTTVENK